MKLGYILFHFIHLCMSDMSVQTSVQMDLSMIPVKLVRSTSCNSCCVAGVTYGVTAVVDDVDRLEVSIVVDATATYESDDEAVFLVMF